MIEESVSECEITEQLESRESFENLYFQVMADVAILLKQRNGVIEPSGEPKCNSHSSVRLPIISLPSFDGSYDSWLEYRDTYVSMIHNSEQLNNIQKFHYLRSSLVSNAAQVIKSVEFTRENYTVAWELLTNRYDNCKFLIHNHVKAIFSMQSLHKESSFHIRKMIDNVLKNLRALKTLGEPTESWDTLIIYIIVSKLDSIIEKEWENYRNNLDLRSNNYVISLNDLLTFLKNKADTLEMIRAHNNSHSHNNNINNKMQHEPYNKRIPQTVHSLATTSKVGAVTASAPRRSTHNVCKLCNANHLLYMCNKFINLSLRDRLKFVNNNNLCLNCLRSGHNVADCFFGSCKQCDQKHNTLLHGNEENLSLSCSVQDHNTHVNSSTSLHSFDQLFVNNNCDNYSLDTVLLSTALVEVAGDDNKYYKTRALLDSGSMHSIMSYSLRNKLHVKSIQSTVQITGIGHLITQSNESCEINLKSLSGDYNTRLHCIVLDRITTSLSSIRVNRKSLNVPVNIGLADPEFHSSSEIDLLIGADCFWDLLIDGKIRLPTGPYLQNTTLGWIISGVIKNNKSHINRTRCNFTQTIELNEQLKKFWELEEIIKPNIQSEETIICEKLFTETTKRVENGRFSVRIPLKKPVEILGDSYGIAEKRFLALERRLQKSRSYKDMYCDFMREYIRLGHMTRINNYNMPCYFIPHHGVLREHSLTTKLRVVFAANTETTSNVSLNDIQLTGPALQNDLFSILLRFRQYQYVACADIEKMYRQILIQEDQRNLQLILWRENSTDPLSVYRLNVVTYGTTSAPYLSMRCIRQLAYECNDKNISRIILEDFYIDDFLSGSNSKSELSDICKKVSDVCSSGCFPLRKWIFNSPDIKFNTHIKHENEANSKSLSLDENCSNRTLGLGWYHQSDEYHFVSKLKTDSNTIITKRLILSVVSQIYDPLGLVSPIIMVGKVLLQKSWLCKIGWDDPVPKDIIIVWNKFVKSLSYLNTIRVPRYVIGNSSYSKIELHIFVDSSQAVYGASAYIRTCDSHDDVIAVRLLCSKTRVAPIKPVTIPRLELCGALLGARLLEKILKSLRLQFDNIVFWTDSNIVLGWLRTPPHLLKTFVQNRVVEISELTSNALWLHVNTKENPADIVTRGASAYELSSMDLWWHGPVFLRENGSQWTQNTVGLLKNLHVFYLNRLLRMFPILALAVLFEASILNRLSDGVYWEVVGNRVHTCRAFWWSTLLHLQNFLNPLGSCLPVTWYLAIDVQLHILSPLVLFWLLRRSKSSSWGALIIAFLVSLTIATSYMFLKDVNQNYFAYYYVNILTRSPPFFVGMIVGYFLRVYRDVQFKMSTILSACVTAICIGLTWGVMYVNFLKEGSEWDNITLSHIIDSFTRSIWAAALGWIIFVCVNGYGGPINWLLSLKLWRIPARISYAMYVVHFSIMTAYYSSKLDPIHFSVGTTVFRCLSFIVITAVVSILLTGLVDIPISMLFKSLLDKVAIKSEKPQAFNKESVQKVTEGHDINGNINEGYVHNENEKEKSNL